MTTANLKEITQDFIRAPYAWPGGYAKMAICHDGQPMCHTCVKENYRLIREAQRAGDTNSGWHVDGVDVHWEGAPLQCANCDKELPSEYGGCDLSEEVKAGLKEFLSIHVPIWVAELTPWDGEDADGDGTDFLELTIGCSADGTTWGYQTGDNSFTGGAYGQPHWAVTSVVPDITAEELYTEIIGQLEELLNS